MAQSKTLLKKLWQKHIEPLNSKQGGGVELFSPTYHSDGFYYLDELANLPTPTKRGQTLFILHPGQKLESTGVVERRNNGHWTVLTLKSKDGLHLVYFDPAVDINGIPQEVLSFLTRANLPYTIDRSSPQTKYGEKSKAFESCGLFCIAFLKKVYA